MDDILIIGTAQPNHIRNAHTGRSHARIGGVGAILAQELTRGGHAPLFHFSASPADTTTEIQQLLDEADVRWENSKPRVHSRPTFFSCTVRNGEPMRGKGHFPVYAANDYDLPHLQDLSQRHPYVVMDSNIHPTVIRRIGAHAPNLILVATAPSRARHIDMAGSDLPKRAVACNNREAQQLSRQGADFGFQSTKSQLNAQALLVTYGARGWAFRDGDDKYRSPAPAAPPNTDFIGAGDSASAGMIHSIITGTDPVAAINDFITRRLEYVASLHENA